jgi:glutamine amidotransferase
MRVVIIDYQAGNLTSVQRAFHHLGTEALITSDPAVVRSADKVVFPGVGAAGACMANLRRTGLDEALRTVANGNRPLLCICIGMQLLFDSSEEDGGTPCLGLLRGTVRRFLPANRSLKVPHMGWNAVHWHGDHPLAAGIADDSHFYFVHSYYCVPDAGVEIIATSDHGERFCAGVRRGGLSAFQFHPEKSGPVGLQLLKNFLADA